MESAVSHREQQLFVELALKTLRKYYPHPNVVEIGSYDVNGSVRGIMETLSPSSYTGVDLIEGPGVDLVCSGHEACIESNSVDICISCESFEHNPKWVETFINMTRMTKEGGCVLVSCASRGRLEHGTYRANNPLGSPGTALRGSEYYKNITVSEFERVLTPSRHFAFFFTTYSRSHRDLYFIGIKSGSNVSSMEVDFRRVVMDIKRIDILTRKEIGWKETVIREMSNIPIGIMSNVLAEPDFQRVGLHTRQFKHFLARLSTREAGSK
jgi:hypothetical protein